MSFSPASTCVDSIFPSGTLPAAKPLHEKEGLVTFDADFLSGDASLSVHADWNLLRGCGFQQCAYGAAICSAYPFMCRLVGDYEQTTASQVLASLHAHEFRSDHYKDLSQTNLPYLGYHDLCANDEIHCEFEHQHIFSTKYEDDDCDTRTPGPISPKDGVHGKLTQIVQNGKLWYVLLHHYLEKGKYDIWTYPHKHQFVLLYAVGVSKNGPRLIGVITSQICNNLCN